MYSVHEGKPYDEMNVLEKIEFHMQNGIDEESAMNMVDSENKDSDSL